MAEDNIVNQQVALEILQKLGLRAGAVANGAEALKALESVHYDRVLMDIQVQVMDGLTAARKIRSSKLEMTAVPIFAGFLEDMPKQIGTLRMFIGQGDADQARAQAHKIKGAAANIGNPALQEIAQAIENTAFTGDMETLNNLMVQMEGRYERLKRTMVSGGFA